MSTSAGSSQNTNSIHLKKKNIIIQPFILCLLKSLSLLTAHVWGLLRETELSNSQEDPSCSLRESGKD